MGAGFSKLRKRRLHGPGWKRSVSKTEPHEPLFEIFPALLPRSGLAQSGGSALAPQVDTQGPRTGSRNRHWFGFESAVLFEPGGEGVGSGPIAGVAANGAPPDQRAALRGGIPAPV